jgi:hypothetical protein
MVCVNQTRPYCVNQMGKTQSKALAERHGRETACGRPARFRLLPVTTRSSRKLVVRSIPISDAGGQCETEERLSRTRRRLFLGGKDISACIIYSTKIMII